MRSGNGLATAGILEIFKEEIADQGGTIPDTFHDGTRLFTRSILPRLELIQPGDQVQGGVALRATEEEVRLHPYVFRLVCRNGAIMARAIQTRHLTELPLLDVQEAESLIAEAVRACCAPEAFVASAEQMRSALEVEADFALNLMPLLSRLSSPNQNQFFADILAQFFREDKRTLYELANAITSVARDTTDPEARWELEELGGEVFARRNPKRPDHAAASLAGWREAVLETCDRKRLHATMAS
jgi:hypothetical protein